MLILKRILLYPKKPSFEKENTNFQKIFQCWNYFNLLFFGKNFVKATVLQKKLLNSWFHEIFFRWKRISRFSTLCTLCVIVWIFEIKNFSWNHYQLINAFWIDEIFQCSNLICCFRFDGKSVSNISTRFKVFYYLIQKLLKCGVIAEKYAKGYKRIHQSLLAEWQLKCCM